MYAIQMTPENKTESLQDLTLAELQERLAETNHAIADRRVEELKVLADGYAKKLVLNGFSFREGMDALRPYLRKRR